MPISTVRVSRVTRRSMSHPSGSKVTAGLDRPERFEWDPVLACRTVGLGVGTVAYTTAGSGSPVLFLHGFADSLFTWRHQLRELRDQLQLWALDLIGSGY